MPQHEHEEPKRLGIYSTVSGMRQKALDEEGVWLRYDDMREAEKQAWWMQTSHDTSLKSGRARTNYEVVSVESGLPLYVTGEGANRRFDPDGNEST